MSPIPSSKNPPSKAKFRCTCEVRCHGDKEVSRRTYDRHAKYRRRRASPSDSESSSNESSSQSGHSDSSGRPRKRLRHGSELPPELTQPEDDLVTNEFDDLLVRPALFLCPVIQWSQQEDKAEQGDSGRISPVGSDRDVNDPGCLDDDDRNTPRTAEVSDSETDSETEQEDVIGPATVIQDLKTALDFITAVKNASLDNGDLDAETLNRLRNPSTQAIDLSNPACSNSRL